MWRSAVCAAASRFGGAARPRAALRSSLRIPGVANLAAVTCTPPCHCSRLAVAVKCGRQPEGTGDGDGGLDAARKRLLDSPPAAAKELKLRQAVQELRRDEESWLKRCLDLEKEGDAVKLDETYKHWKDSRDELDMYERDPRRWLRQHGRFRGLGEHMTLADKSRVASCSVSPLSCARGLGTD
ncbi:chromosome-associated kinesin KIF4A isoform X1 isoform A [Micractinium conductrix]|uniref:Chromosome-associated kinesin KIF4A isoform X1 isoform A n=1 Tax=Micractinium conductrix TaxID=554055 RepID=A0A2P6VHL6_9CHLO|nr:chromosome-associated kinesin KIF4A isoform X1 isoform A [Micractinium conductrix]|eukprot:PSC73583.1 chromosome-associated kinesin KIF4A isoform X1 isoform A [Micractinium conductrix]